MDVSSHYRDAWEGFWRGTSDAPGEAMWDSDASLGSVPQAELLLSHADPALPVIDLGCGSGTQTRHLATRFARAVGVDLSAAAVEHARRADTAKAAEYEQLDLVDAVAVDALARRTGETNVYMRAVIHQSEPQDRPAVAAAVAAFLGAGGRAFVVELTPASKAALERAAQSPGRPAAQAPARVRARSQAGRCDGRGGADPAARRGAADPGDRRHRPAHDGVLRRRLAHRPGGQMVRAGTRVKDPAGGGTECRFVPRRGSFTRQWGARWLVGAPGEDLRTPGGMRRVPGPRELPGGAPWHTMAIRWSARGGP